MSQSRRSGADPLTELRRSLALMWEMPSVPARGPKPGLSVERIVAAAVALADAEGLPALSMRNLAAALGVGTMTLYRYVPGRAELMALMCDHVQADEPAVGDRTPPAVEQGWREQLRWVAEETWERYRRHPWMITIEQGRPLLGPRAMRSVEHALGALQGTRLDDRERLGVIVLITSFVTGVARSEFESRHAAGQTGISDEDWWRSHEPYLHDAMTTFPRLSAAGEAGGWGEGATEIHLRLGLEVILAGVAARIEPR